MFYKIINNFPAAVGCLTDKQIEEIEHEIRLFLAANVFSVGIKFYNTMKQILNIMGYTLEGEPYVEKPIRITPMRTEE